MNISSAPFDKLRATNILIVEEMFELSLIIGVFVTLSLSKGAEDMFHKNY